MASERSPAASLSDMLEAAEAALGHVAGKWVDNDIVWRILSDHLPPLIRQLRDLLPPPPPS